MSKLVLMGSGETAPSLVPVHRELLASLSSPRACWLDTPYGFQENADILSQKTVEFFAQSLGQKLQVARFRSSEQTAVETELAYALVRQSHYVFAGPGSPSYTQRHWARSDLPRLFLEKLDTHGNIIVFASAALCPIGALCLPVYEIYKVGMEPHWLPGLEILPRLGFPAVVLPHYNNTVGGNHDTRFCYLGERRLRILEEQMESDLWIWGVDEHTAVTIDLEEGTFKVQGKGGFTLRRSGQSRFFASGETGSAELLRTPENAPLRTIPRSTAATGAASRSTQGLITDLAQPLAERFAEQLKSGSGLGAAQALLDFEQLLRDWSGDSDVHHWELARARFRNLLAQLGQGAQRGLQDPSEPIRPFVQSLLDIREEARAERQFGKADHIRDLLLQNGVEIQDTPQGTRWSLKKTESCAL